MIETKAFQNSEFGSIRIIENDGNTWFVGADVCSALGYSNPRKAISDHVPVDDRNTVTNRYGIRGNPNVTVINESGLYALIFGSKLESAARFKRWITSEVLPAIRKTGGYVSDDEMFIRTYLPGLGEAEKAIFKTTLSALKSANEKIAADAPKVRFAESVSASADTILISDLAKLLKQNGVDIGRDRLFARLREEGYLCSSSSERNMPTQYAMNLGLFQVDERTWRAPYGVVHTNFTTRVTGKGQRYFIRRYCNSNG